MKILLEKDHKIDLWIRQPITTSSNGFQYHMVSKITIVSERDVVYNLSELRHGPMQMKYTYRFTDPLPLYDNKPVESMEWYYG